MSDLTEAIKAGDVEEVGRILDREPSRINDVESEVPLTLFALYVGQPSIAELFVTRGRKLTFHEACALGRREQVESMLREDPELLNQRSPDGFPPLGLAIFFRRPEVARLLIEAGADVNAAADNAQRVAPVHAAAAVCDHATMPLLIERGADLGAKQQMDYTALHGAASRGDMTMVRLLLVAGADASAAGADGATPFDVAMKYGHPECAEFLKTAIPLPRERVPERSEGGRGHTRESDG